MDSDKMYNLICKKEFEQLNEKLDSLDKSIRGNGRPGIQQRLLTVENCIGSLRRFIWIIITAIVSVGVFIVRGLFV